MEVVSEKKKIQGQRVYAVPEIVKSTFSEVIQVEAELYCWLCHPVSVSTVFTPAVSYTHHLSLSSEANLLYDFEGLNGQVESFFSPHAQGCLGYSKGPSMASQLLKNEAIQPINIVRLAVWH